MFFYRGGNKLLQISHDGDNPLEYHITIFCHHCIQRYCERFLKSTVEINEKLYVEILKRNSVLYSSEEITPKGDKALYLVSDDGIFIGEQINKCGLLIKTYISRAEFFEKQESLANSIMKEIINYKRTNHLLDYTGLAG